MMTDFDDVRRTLVTLLTKPLDQPVLDVDELNTTDKLFLTATCAARMMLEAICATALYDEQRAADGLNKMLADLRTQINEVCAEGRALNKVMQ
jgi:hypothetical protein